MQPAAVPLPLLVLPVTLSFFGCCATFVKRSKKTRSLVNFYRVGRRLILVLLQFMKWRCGMKISSSLWQQGSERAARITTLMLECRFTVEVSFNSGGLLILIFQ